MTKTRREFLQVAAAGAAGLAVGGGASAGSRLPHAKSCIFINMVGGPSHIDTFDPKPDAPSEVRGPFGTIRTKVPGLHLSELFPKLAGIADKFALIRSMHHDGPPIHEAGLQLNNTGRLFRDVPSWPNVAAMISKLDGRRDGDHASWCLFPNARLETGIDVLKGMSTGWLPGYHNPITYAQFYDQDEYDFGLGCELAIEVLEGGLRFVTINMFDTVFDSPSWDCHADRGSLSTSLQDYRDTVAPSFDDGFSTLLTNLDERGLLESTLVVATGEFGRTPKRNANGGRDHWANCWTALVAGGGVKGGRILGASDATGSEPADRPATPQELVATVFHALGVPQDATIPGPGPDRKPVAVYPGTPLRELF